MIDGGMGCGGLLRHFKHYGRAVASCFTTGMSRSLLLCVLLLISLTACKVELYTDLEEREANEMLALLLKNSIDATKVSVKDTLVSLMVDKDRVADAVDLLRANGYPRQAFDSMGQIFQKEGLVSSPTEERVRYIYALSQEISKTLMQIDGVLEARVHLVLPDNDPTAKTATPSSAAVLIKYNEDQLLREMVPQIKLLVTNSIEGLEYDNVSLIMFPSQEFDRTRLHMTYATILGMRIDTSTLTNFWIFVGIMGILIVGMAAGGGYLLFFSRHKGARAEHAE
jgi:type III secretion apparatus lipoprotein, YscJ/HrcJ family